MIPRALWSLVLRLALPLVFVRLWWRGSSEPGYRRAWHERLDFGPQAGIAPSTGGLKAVHSARLPRQIAFGVAAICYDS